MESINTIINRMFDNQDTAAIYWNGEQFSYKYFHEQVDIWCERLNECGITQGSIVGFIAEYSPQVCALMFALMKTKAILVPFTLLIENELDDFIEIAGVEYLFKFAPDDTWEIDKIESPPRIDLIEVFKNNDAPGLVVFSSGSTGKPKGILQDCERVMRKFVEIRPGWRTVLFLMLDHFGGFNTLISTFAYGGMAVCLPSRGPEVVCKCIEESRATLLPVSPTFINLLLASQCYSSYDLSSVKLITYGTEVMPATTLLKLKEVFPNAKIKQTYGLSELGVLRSKSESDDSVWVKIGGSGFEIKVIDNVLWVRSEANMVGYLNAPNPIDDKGWMCTGDTVEVRGEYMRILGRESDMINVGGQKVFPTEIENVLLEADNIAEATVVGVSHPVMGNIVKARVSLINQEDSLKLKERLRKFCLERMAKYKVPVKYELVNHEAQKSLRHKKVRK